MCTPRPPPADCLPCNQSAGAPPPAIDSSSFFSTQLRQLLPCISRAATCCRRVSRSAVSSPPAGGPEGLVPAPSLEKERRDGRVCGAARRSRGAACSASCSAPGCTSRKDCVKRARSAIAAQWQCWPSGGPAVSKAFTTGGLSTMKRWAICERESSPRPSSAQHGALLALERRQSVASSFAPSSSLGLRLCRFTARLAAHRLQMASPILT